MTQSLETPPALAVFDIDGTLLTFDGQCSSLACETLAALRANGVLTAIATGRPMAALSETLDKIGPVDLAVLSNGSLAIDLRTDETLFEATVPGPEVDRLVRSVRSDVDTVGVALDIGVRTIEEAGFARRLPPRVDFEHPVADVLAAAGEPTPAAQRVIFFHDEHDDDVEGLAAAVRPHVGRAGELILAPLIGLVEVTPEGINKATALAHIVDALGLNAADTVAFGDGLNDLEMLAWAGTGVAMGSAGERLRAVADHVTGTVEADGVPTFLAPLVDLG